MEVKELREQKMLLEEKIATLINDFEMDAEIIVSNLELDRDDFYTEDEPDIPKTSIIGVKVSLKI